MIAIVEVNPSTFLIPLSIHVAMKVLVLRTAFKMFIVMELGMFFCIVCAMVNVHKCQDMVTLIFRVNMRLRLSATLVLLHVKVYPSVICKYILGPL